MKYRNPAIVTAATLLGGAGLAQAQLIAENFDNVANLTSHGWSIQNHSSPLGSFSWSQGDIPTFGAQSSAGYVAASFDAAMNEGTINDWLITPAVSMHNGDTLRFWTRTVDDPTYADRLQVRLNPLGTTNVGTSATDVGDFTVLLLDIDPTYVPTNYPSVWTQYTVMLTGLPAGGASGRIAFRYFVENGGPSGTNSDYIGVDTVSLDAAGIADGACCLDTGCVSISQGQCVARGGVFRGAGVGCATASCPAATVWAEADHGDAGQTIATTQVVTGSGPLLSIRGSLNSLTDVDLYQISICQAGQFSASTVGNSLVDTKLALFDATGHGVEYNDDDPAGSGFQSALDHMFVTQAGNYYLAITSFGNDPTGATTSGLIWNENPLTTERQPDGPAAAEALGGWTQNGVDEGDYTIALTGACFAGSTPPPSCYANCDASTTVPFLNVNDFICFQTQFAAGASYANCDHSTTPPILNVNDFICFQSMFAGGCSAP